MSAVRSDPAPQPPSLKPMTIGVLDAVLAIEVQAYTFPWSRGNFVDSLAAGYLLRVLQSPGGEVLGYFVAMPGFEEMHLLNITVAAAHEGRGYARLMLSQLYALSAHHEAGARTRS